MNRSQTDLSFGRKTAETFGNCLLAIGNARRLEIVQYCLEPRKFTEIIVNLKMNPASFKFHSQVLMDCGLIERTGRGVYKTTELGKKMLQLVQKAAQIGAK
jgi:predicted transcriptional regulator